MISPRLRSFVALIVGLSAMFPAVAGAAPADPAPILVKTINSVIDLALGQSPSVIQQRVPEIRTTMSESFAIDLIVQRAFGRNWSKLTPAQKTEAADLVGRLIIQTYAVQLSTGERPAVTITSSRDLGPDRKEVVSTVTRGPTAANVVYRFGLLDGQWKIYDVLAEGVSVVGNYRQQFDAHFEKKSADDLLATLKARVAAPPVVAEEKK